METKKYLVKCDDCKRTMCETREITKSYAGGLCNECRELARINATPAAGLLLMGGKEISSIR